MNAYVPEEDILSKEPMWKHTTFRVGGEADCFVRISSPSQLAGLIPRLKENGIPWFIMGNGSNLLVGDKGFRGVILQIGSKMGSFHGRKPYQGGSGRSAFRDGEICHGAGACGT